MLDPDIQETTRSKANMPSPELIQRLKALPFCLMPAAATAHPGGPLHELSHRMGGVELMLVLAVIFLAVPRLLTRPGRARQRRERSKRRE